MLRKVVLASAVALPFGLLGSASVMAQTPATAQDYVPKNIVPYDQQSEPVVRGPVDCVTARKIVRKKGYDDVEAEDCNGDDNTYTFRAERNGRVVLLRVDKEDGRVMGGAS
jgi:hypothetical protein